MSNFYKEHNVIKMKKNTIKMSSTLEAVHIFSAIVIKKQIAFAEGI
jgi:hypothetical protein